MIKIGILGDIGAGKSYVAKGFGYPVFNADSEVATLYKKDEIVFGKLKKALPKFISSFPINKNEISEAILANESNLKKIVKIVHLKVKKKMNIFLNKNKNKKFVILDIPLLLENKINEKDDILVFVQSKKSQILKRLKKRKNFNLKLINRFKNIQLPLDFKKKKSKFIIKNNFTDKSVKISIKKILMEISK
jgi:dephospho-CoA kinase|tara:strand:+ start:243 stop:815 length:573 start_codon:yes stop_codon:yes gene_type:complete